jgi:hypothetical protein
MRCRAALATLAILALAGCGKSNIVAVRRPVVPFYICVQHSAGLSCPGKFDVGRLIGLTLAEAERLAERHHYTVRRIAAPGDHGALERDFESNRLDVECSSPSPNAIVVRFVEIG